MYKIKFIAIVTGPEEYLKGELLVEEFTISGDEVSEVIEGDGEDPDNPTVDQVADAISYLKEEYVAEWEQRWCKATLLTEEQFETIKNTKI